MRILCIDCEGPITLNDNAFEICQSFLPCGDKFFTIISRYDDYLADVIKKERYTAGGTLKLIVPFFKAYRLTNEKIKQFSKRSLKFVPGAKDMLKNLKSEIQIFIISTSYSPYIDALCEIIDLPRENTFSTPLDLDSYFISENERKQLIKIYQRILKFSLSPPDKNEQISLETKKTLEKLDEIFFHQIPSMKCGNIFKKVNPVGGKEKARIVKKIAKEKKCRIEDIIYIGDSITDAVALRLVKEKGGVAISFNGNFYALREAEFACISNNALPLFLIIKNFKEEGKKGVEKIAFNWPEKLKKEDKEKLFSLNYPGSFILIEKKNIADIIRLSEEIRKKIRGEEIGKLG